MAEQIITHSPEETAALAQRLAQDLKGGEVVAFTGGMGAGKTAFTRGLVMGLGAGDVVSSPTFALVNEYQGRLTVEHFDMYGWRAGTTCIPPAFSTILARIASW